MADKQQVKKHGPYRSLRDFLAMLETQGELVRVAHPVSTVLEMTEIQTRLLAEGGPAVLFEHPVMEDGTPLPMPVLVNLFGTVKRVALGVTMGDEVRTEAAQLRTVGETLAFLRQPEPPGGLKDALELLPLARQVLAMKPGTKKSAPCQEVVLTGDEIDPLELDTVVVPMVAFDDAHQRIGMGGGYYDTTFSALRRPRAPRRPKLVGVAFECQKVRKIKANPWDIAVCEVLTEA